MTIEQLQAKRDEILGNIGIVRAQHGERSVEFSDATKSLALIDSEIAKVSTRANAPRTTLAKFRND